MKVRIFTDGACSENPGPGGWAVVFNTDSRVYTMSGNEQLTTNNRMELRAVIEALKKIINKKNHKPDVEYEIYSDSAYVVNTINRNWYEAWQVNGWKTTKGDEVKNKDLWEEYLNLYYASLRLRVKITINKIKGHAGNTFNELVDKLAKEESMKAKVNE